MGGLGDALDQLGGVGGSVEQHRPDHSRLLEGPAETRTTGTARPAETRTAAPARSTEAAAAPALAVSGTTHATWAESTEFSCTEHTYIPSCGGDRRMAAPHLINNVLDTKLLDMCQ